MSNLLSIMEWREVRCPNCHKLLFKMRGIADIEVVCARCSNLVTHSVEWPQVGETVVVRARKVLMMPVGGS